jgi:hypothetical protein
MPSIPWNGRTRRLLFVFVMLFVLTFPLVNTLLVRSRVDRDGVDVRATVVQAVHDGDRYLVAFRLPKDVDPEQERYAAVVEKATYDKAGATKQVDVRVLEDEPRRHHVEGEIYSRSPWIFTIVGDLVVLLVGLWWVRVGRRRPPLRLLAMRDVEAVDDDEPNALTRDSGDMYDVVGPVSAVDGSSVTYALDDRAVEVRLNGYDVHVAVGSRGRAWGMLVA